MINCSWEAMVSLGASLEDKLLQLTADEGFKKISEITSIDMGFE